MTETTTTAAWVPAAPLLAAPLAWAWLPYSPGWWLVFAATALVAPSFLVLLARRRRGAAFVAIALWAACYSLAIAARVAAEPGLAAAVPNGSAYVAEMQAWLATGTGVEAEPRRFLPLHALHAAGFVVAALVSAGVAALAMGAALVGWMSAYVGSVMHEASSPMLAFVVAWHPWALVRVASFIALGVVAAEPLLFAALRRPYPGLPRQWLALAAAGLAVDVLAKTFLAASWRELLLRL